MVGPPSLSFDRAADYYDKTRALAPEAQAAVTRLLTTELTDREPVLETGVGTGRIALALNRAGVDMFGTDLSGPMLRRLVQNAGGLQSFPLCVADAATLPFRKASFGAALTCHVLHLIPAWQQVLSEIVRVVRPGGLYLNELGGWHQLSGPRVDMMRFFAEEAGFSMMARGANKVDEVDRMMISLGAGVRPLPTITHTESSTYEEIIGHLEKGTWSCTWQTTDAARRAAGARLRPWAAERYGDLSQSLEYSIQIAWRAYDLAR
jgi:ubiquinone/menaquinone biosynthesis C-methylase UbiE